MGSLALGKGADHVLLHEGGDQAAPLRVDVAPAVGTARPAYGLLWASRYQFPASTGSWKLRVWERTLVEIETWAMDWPTPSCGRMAVPIRKPSVA